MDFRQKSDEELSQLGAELAVEYFNFDRANRIILNAIEAGSLGTRFGLDHGLRGSADCFPHISRWPLWRWRVNEAASRVNSKGPDDCKSIRQ
jgi:hypothetical protein